MKIVLQHVKTRLLEFIEYLELEGMSEHNPTPCSLQRYMKLYMVLFFWFSDECSSQQNIFLSFIRGC